MTDFAPERLKLFSTGPQRLHRPNPWPPTAPRGRRHGPACRTATRQGELLLRPRLQAAGAGPPRAVAKKGAREVRGADVGELQRGKVWKRCKMHSTLLWT